MTIPASRKAQDTTIPAACNKAAEQAVTRINSRDLFRQMREVEIAHEGRIYRLRLTQLNKLILTA
ncbi:hemin uptake protein HemP [Herminiimonas sp. NPDC097707]|uniref:hemin uptake protein HemP n=1 Tax=Herminiimonas sp. NPDC097707 TaxID=3364007 RepID=UPI00383ACF17